MPVTKQLTLNLESRPGVLAKLSGVLAEAGVNIIALCAGDAAGRGKIRILVNNPAKAQRALKAARYRPSVEPAFVVRLANKPGRLARVTARLAKARINIKSAYATTSGRGGTVVLTVSSPGKARRLLR
jgi:hypothetical protein